MAHYARVVSGTVDKIIVAEASFFDNFVDDSPGEWIETSLTGSIRKQYAGAGYTYDASNDVFVQQKPYPSWTLDASHDWQPPIPYPDDGERYIWNEQTQAWDLIEE